MPSGAPAAELSLADWVGLASVIVTIAAIPLTLVGAHFHNAIRNDDARATIIKRLTSTRRRDAYREYLRSALDWLDQVIGLPPLARANSHGRRVFGLKSLKICVTLSLAYSVGSFLVGWLIGTPGALGQVTLIEAPIVRGWEPEWLVRLSIVFVLVVGFPLMIFLYWLAHRSVSENSRPGWLWRRRADDAFLSGRYVAAAFLLCGGIAITFAVAYAIMGAVVLAAAMTFVGALAVAIGLTLTITGAVALAVAMAVILSARSGFNFLLFLIVLPYLNALLDWISLTVSRWFGRAIIDESGSPAALSITLCLALLDLVAAVAFAFAMAWLLAFGVETSGRILDLSLDLEMHVSQAAGAPWTIGFWTTFMVLSTLVPTAIHFILALGAIFMAWSGNPLNRLAARRLASGNEAHYLFPQLYLTFGWMVPIFVVSPLLIWTLAQVTKLFTLVIGPVETLPDLLRDTALHGIGAAQAIFGSVP